MASRESTGMQIAFILTAMLTVALGITTFVFYGQAEKATALAEQAEGAKKTALDNVEATNFKLQYLTHIIGAVPLDEAQLGIVVPSIEADADLGPVHQQYQADMATFGEGLPPAELNYQALPAHLLMAYRGKNVSVGNLSRENQDMKKRTLQHRTDQTARADAADQNFVDAKGELEKSRSDYTTAVQRTQQAQQAQLTSFKTEESRLTTEIAKKNDDIKKRQRQIGIMTDTIANQRERIQEFEDEPFEVPDGRISWINQETRTCWVNLGLADGLRRQVTFSVYDEDAMNLLPSTGSDKKKKGSGEETKQQRKVDLRKAKIEITRVIDQHLAEARIIEDYASDPILPGDIVFSPAWKPGRRVRFALVPFFDIDGDRQSDADLVRNIITSAGGVIDAEVHDNGDSEGKVTASTRYIVIGAEPLNLASKTKLIDARGDLMSQARALGVQEITLGVLLDLMGYKAEIRTVGLGRNVDPHQFKPEAPEGRMRSSVQNIFRERTPPKRRKSGAY